MWIQTGKQEVTGAGRDQGESGAHAKPFVAV